MLDLAEAALPTANPSTALCIDMRLVSMHPTPPTILHPLPIALHGPLRGHGGPSVLVPGTQ